MTPLRWTREAPKEAGHFWCRVVGNERQRPFVVEVSVDNVSGETSQTICRVPCVEKGRLPFLSYYNGGQHEYYEWAGPIAPPEEAT